MGQAQSDAKLNREEEAKMMAAIGAGSTEDAKTLLEANPSLIYVHSKDGLNVWHLAAQSGDAKVVELVAAAVTEVLAHQKKQDKMLAQVNAGFNTVNMAVNHIAAATTAAIPSQIAIPMGRNIDKDAQTREGKTALMVAIQGGHHEAAAALLACGVDVYKGDIRGNTVLHMAAWQGDVPGVKLLLDHADKVEAPDLPESRRLVNTVNLTGLTPCHFAAWRGHGSVVRELINAGAYLAVGASGDSMGDVSCNKGSTPLHLAAMKGDVPIIRLILKAHAKLLELAAAGEHIGEHRPRDPRRIPDGYGKTAYTIAFDLGRSDAAEVLDPTVALQEAINRAGGAKKGAASASPARKHGSTDGMPLPAGASKKGAAALGSAANATSPSGGYIKAGWEGAAQSTATQGEAGGKLPVLAPPPKAAAAVPALAKPPSAAAVVRQQQVGAQKERQQEGEQQQKERGQVQERPQGKQGNEEAKGDGEEEAAKEQGQHQKDKGAAEKQQEGEAAAAGGVDGVATAGSGSDGDNEEVKNADSAAAEGAGAENAGGDEPSAAAASAAAASFQEPPEDLVCPITGEVLHDPVRACDGRCYEREAIETWLMLGNRAFPGGHARITSHQLTPDGGVRARAAEWRAAH